MSELNGNLEMPVADLILFNVTKHNNEMWEVKS